MASRSLGRRYLKRALRRNIIGRNIIGRNIIGRTSIRRGVLGGSPMWFAVFVARKLFRWSSKVLKRGVMPLRFTESLKPGESFIIRHLDHDSSRANEPGTTRGRRKT